VCSSDLSGASRPSSLCLSLCLCASVSHSVSAFISVHPRSPDHASLDERPAYHAPALPATVAGQDPVGNRRSKESLMQRITRDHLHGPHGLHQAEPVAFVTPGERFCVETTGGCSPEAYKIGLLTGPIGVRGASPGDTLAVHVHDIRITDTEQTIAFGPGRPPCGGVLCAYAKEKFERRVQIRDGVVHFGRGIELKVRPMMGWIKVADPAATTDPASNGGNMDNKQLTAGTTIYLQACVDGAKLALGDLHACMGDGEISGAAVETAGEVELTVDVLPATRTHRPIVLTADEFLTIGNRLLPVQNSYHQCVSDMVHFVMETHGMSFEEANMLICLAGDLRVCNVVSWLPIFRMAMPRHLLLPPEQLLRRELGELPYPEVWVGP
jgi:amidase